MPVLTSERKKPKRSKIRYAEYYDLQKTLDSLYADSLKGKVFVHLMELISSEEILEWHIGQSKETQGAVPQE